MALKFFFKVFCFLNNVLYFKSVCIILRILYEENYKNLVYQCSIIIFLYSVTVIKIRNLYINTFILQIMLNTEKKKIFVAFLLKCSTKLFDSFFFGYLFTVFIIAYVRKLFCVFHFLFYYSDDRALTEHFLRVHT